ncbi:MAG: type I methionyl aminopeptidase [bacterium]|nr:type I methionyl aminopeptidase [bacterium]
MITRKTPEEIAIMRAGGRIAGRILGELVAAAKPGVTTGELEEMGRSLIVQARARPSFLLEPDYHWATCINLNAGVVHGIPNERKIANGDVVSIDLGVLYEEFHTDVSWSFRAGGERGDAVDKFLAVGEKALSKATSTCRSGNHLGDISAAIQGVILPAGYSVVRRLTGHGIGRKLHEDPLVPGVGRPGTGPKLASGMTLAVEVIYALGKPEIILEDDGWTISTRDGKIAGLFEQTIAITEKGPVVLTPFDWRRGHAPVGARLC